MVQGRSFVMGIVFRSDPSRGFLMIRSARPSPIRRAALTLERAQLINSTGWFGEHNRSADGGHRTY
jgi:hypothetical protein